MKSKWLGAFLVFLTLMFAEALASSGKPPLVVIALVKVKPGMELSFKQAATKVIEPSRKEKGCVDYDFQQSTEDPTEFSTVEHWKSEQALADHIETPHVKQFFKEVSDLFAPGYPRIRKYRKFGG